MVESERMSERRQEHAKRERRDENGPGLGQGCPKTHTNEREGIGPRLPAFQ